MKMEVCFPGNMKVDASFRGFTVSTDQPLSLGGENSAPTPFELFIASIATCAGIYVKGFCQQRGLTTEGIKLTLDTKSNPSTGMVEDITIQILVPSDFPQRYKPALINAAELCAVKKHLSNPPTFNIEAITV